MMIIPFKKLQIDAEGYVDLLCEYLESQGYQYGYGIMSCQKKSPRNMRYITVNGDTMFYSGGLGVLSPVTDWRKLSKREARMMEIELNKLKTKEKNKMEPLDRINRLEAELSELRKQIEQPEAKHVPGFWEPKIGEEYWTIVTHMDSEAYEEYEGVVTAAGVEWFGWGGDLTDRTLLSMGNVYETKGEALKRLDREKVVAQLRKMADGHVPKYKGDNYFLYKDVTIGYLGSNKWAVRSHKTVLLAGVIYFKTHEAAKTALEEIGDKRLDLLLEVV
jgi:hypothetical protein